jgi:hypothetical protein
MTTEELQQTRSEILAELEKKNPIRQQITELKSQKSMLDKIAGVLYRKIREGLGWTLREAGKMSGWSAAYVHLIEEGRRPAPKQYMDFIMTVGRKPA